MGEKDNKKNNKKKIRVVVNSIYISLVAIAALVYYFGPEHIRTIEKSKSSTSESIGGATTKKTTAQTTTKQSAPEKPKKQNQPVSSSSLKVTQFVMCEGLDNRQPVGISNSFSSSIARVYCYIKIVGATQVTTITHTWYYKNTVKAQVKLSVQPGTWRTWSAKNMIPEWKGQWRVDASDASGFIIGSVKFQLR